MQTLNVPGITSGLPFADYLNLPGSSASALKKLMRSPLAYKWALDHPDHPDHTSSPAMVLGSAAHTAILEPHRMKTDYVLWDGGDRRGKAWTEFKEANTSRSILTAGEFADVKGMHSSVRGFPPAARYLEQGLAEVTMQWTDPSGREMRGRVDWVTRIDGQVVLVDLKTTRDSSARHFGSDAFRLGYHLQFALYCEGWLALTGEMPRFVVLAVESKAPYEPAVFDVPEDLLDRGSDELGRLLATLQECETSDTWPPAAQDEQPLRLPAWAMAEDDDVSDLGLTA